MDGLTVSVTEFKAKCLDLLDQVNERRVSRLDITRHGRIVAVVTPPPCTEEDAWALHGCMPNSVIIPEGVDLTDPVLDEPLDAEAGILHR